MQQPRTTTTVERGGRRRAETCKGAQNRALRCTQGVDFYTTNLGLVVATARPGLTLLLCLYGASSTPQPGEELQLG